MELEGQLKTKFFFQNEVQKVIYKLVLVTLTDPLDRR